ncbi:MAG: hypothetical protein M3290_08480 [Actinomycetota bacterium]|nr:hypothetical protein [Actinomycetota bacterium]
MADVERIVRLKSAIEAASRTARDDQTEQIAFSQEPLQRSYRNLRAQVRDAIEPELIAEFDGLFPEDPPDIINRSQGRLALMASRALQAKGLLETMAGWLGGIVASATEERRLRIEAEEYAKERVRQERGVGLGE